MTLGAIRRQAIRVHAMRERALTTRSWERGGYVDDPSREFFGRKYVAEKKTVDEQIRVLSEYREAVLVLAAMIEQRIAEVRR